MKVPKTPPINAPVHIAFDVVEAIIAVLLTVYFLLRALSERTVPTR
jgi:hypothetical protein